MSSAAWEETVPSKRSGTPRSRLKLSDIWNFVEERIEFLRDLAPQQADALEQVHFKLSKYIRDEYLESGSQDSTTIRTTCRHNVKIFLDSIDEKMRDLLRESILELFISISYEKKLIEMRERITTLEAELFEAKSVFTVRQVLEQAVNGERTDRGHRFASLLMDNSTLQNIFNRKFKSAWFKGKLVVRMPLGEKADLTCMLFDECYANASKKEVHRHPSSAPIYGMVVKEKNYTTLQRAFLKVVAEYMKKGLLFI